MVFEDVVLDNDSFVTICGGRTDYYVWLNLLLSSATSSNTTSLNSEIRGTSNLRVLYILQRGVQWKQGVVVYIML